LLTTADPSSFTKTTHTTKGKLLAVEILDPEK